MSSASPIAGATCSASATEASETKRPSSVRAVSSASRVLPTPPGPVSVSRRTSPARSSSAIRAQVVLAAERRRRRAGERRGAARDLVGEDRLLELAQLRAGREAELLVQAGAQVAVGRERVRLAAEPVERAHLLTAQALAQRMLGDQRLQLGGEQRVLAALEVGLDALLERQHAQLFQPPHLRLREGLVAELAQRRAAPQRERLLERLGRLGRAARGEQRAAFLVAVGEALARRARPPRRRRR